MARLKNSGRVQVRLKPKAAMGKLHNRIFADHIVIFIEPPARRRPTAMPQPHWCAAAIGARPECRCKVGTEVGDNARAGRSDDLKLVGPGVDAMGQRQPFCQQADIAEIMDDAIGKMFVGISALIDGLQQMHVDAAAGQRRILGNRLQQRPRAPLHPGRPQIAHRSSVLISPRRWRRQLEIVARRHRRLDE